MKTKRYRIFVHKEKRNGSLIAKYVKKRKNLSYHVVKISIIMSELRGERVERSEDLGD